MRENRANKSFNSRLTRWVDRLLPFDFTIDHLTGSKMGLVDYISRDPKRFLLNVENYTDFAAANSIIKQSSNTPHSNDKLGSDFAPRNREFSAIPDNDNTIGKISTK